MTGVQTCALPISPFMIGPDLIDDNWTIMESGGEPRWEIAEHITELSEEVSQ